LDTFQAMAEKGLFVIDRVVQEEMGGGVDLINNRWFIPGAVPVHDPLGNQAPRRKQAGRFMPVLDAPGIKKPGQKPGFTFIRPMFLRGYTK
jgi:hypothetical protein